MALYDYMKRFKDYDKNDKCSFVKYDIRELYLSITETTHHENYPS